MATPTPDNGWINTAEATNPDRLARACRILATTPYATLSTCSAAGEPWGSPLFFVYDNAWTIYWSSAIAARHSQHLATNQGRATLVIYSTHGSEGQGQGLYLAGRATVLAPDRVSFVIDLLNRRSSAGLTRAARDYLPPSPRRLYQLQPDAVWITGERLPYQGVLIDTKVRLDLASLQAHMGEDGVSAQG